MGTTPCFCKASTILLSEMVGMYLMYLIQFPASLALDKNKVNKKLPFISVISWSLYTVTRYFFTQGYVWSTNFLQFCKKYSLFHLTSLKGMHPQANLNQYLISWYTVEKPNNESALFMALIICSLSWKEQILSLVTLLWIEGV